MKKVNILLVFVITILTSCTNGLNEKQTGKLIIAETETTYAEETTYESLATSVETTEKNTRAWTEKELKEYGALFPVYIDGYEDYIDKYGNVVTNYKFDRADYFYDGMAIVEKDGLMGAIDLTGAIVIPIQYSEMEHFSCGLASVTNEYGKIGYINKLGEVVIPFDDYTYAGYCSENIVIVEKGYNGYEFINSEGEKIGGLDGHGDYISGFQYGYMVMDNAYYNVNGEYIMGSNVVYDQFVSVGFLPGFYEGVSAFLQLKEEYFDKYYGTDKEVEELFNWDNWYCMYINTDGEDIFNKKFDAAGNFSEGMAVVVTDGVTGCIDKSGNFVFFNDNLLINDYFSEGYMSYSRKVGEDYKYGFLDNKGKEIINAEYYGCYTEGFHDGMALMADNREKTQLSYINKKNEIVYTFNVPDGYRKYYDTGYN